MILFGVQLTWTSSSEKSEIHISSGIRSCQLSPTSKLQILLRFTCMIYSVLYLSYIYQHRILLATTDISISLDSWFVKVKMTFEMHFLLRRYNWIIIWQFDLLLQTMNKQLYVCYLLVSNMSVLYLLKPLYKSTEILWCGFRNVGLAGVTHWAKLSFRIRYALEIGRKSVLVLNS